MKKLLLFIFVTRISSWNVSEILIEAEIKKSQDADFVVLLLGSYFLFLS